MNLFTNAATVVFWFFNKYCNKHFKGRRDTATDEQLTEKNKKFEFRKVFQLPWMFWAVLAFSLVQSSTALTFSQNATELAEQRFDVDSIQAGWYSSLSQYAGKREEPTALRLDTQLTQCRIGFFLVPCIGVFIDIFGHRASISE